MARRIKKIGRFPGMEAGQGINVHIGPLVVPAVELEADARTKDWRSHVLGTEGDGLAIIDPDWLAEARGISQLSDEELVLQRDFLVY
jgi:hypothetical protein